MSQKNSGKTEGFVQRPTKYERMRMKTGNKKSKTTYQRVMLVNDETVHDVLSSWFTATGFINKDEFVIAARYLAGEDCFAITVENSNGKKEAEESEEVQEAQRA